MISLYARPADSNTLLSLDASWQLNVFHLCKAQYGLCAVRRSVFACIASSRMFNGWQGRITSQYSQLQPM